MLNLDFLADASAVLVTRSIELMRLSGEDDSRSNIVAVVRSAPRDPADLEDDQFRSSSFCWLCLEKAVTRQDPRIGHLTEYFCRRLPGMEPAARKLLEESVCGAFLAFDEAMSRDERTILCLGCRKVLNVPPGAEGRRCRCRGCGYAMTIPEWSTPFSNS